MMPDAAGRGAITGREGVFVWDFLRLGRARTGEAFTRYPHLTLAIERDRLAAVVTIPNGMGKQFRRRLTNGGSDGFARLLSDVTQRLTKALRSDKGAAPWAIVVQRRYPTQRSSPIVDATLEFDLRTAFQLSYRRGKGAVKAQPQWLEATYNALVSKKSNLQLSIGGIFPYSRSSSVKTGSVIEAIADTWLACKPLFTRMGLSR